MTFKDLLRRRALQIYPNRSLDELTAKPRTKQDRAALYQIMRHGGEFLDAYWIAAYWPVSARTLNSIYNHPTTIKQSKK